MTKAFVSPRVSVIMPVYNCQDYLQRCLDSLYMQSLQNYEIIAVNDGSSDESPSILKENASKKANFIVLDQENKGQGNARNQAIEIAKGEYVLFLDADDFIEPVALEMAVERADADKADVVHFDWKMSHKLQPAYADFVFFNKEPFSNVSYLENDECDEFLCMINYFSVNNLYRRSFLNAHNIRYSERRIYEDNTFIVQVANNANKISIIDSPLYNVQLNRTSTTYTDTKTDKHYRDHIHAIEESFGILKPRTSSSEFYLAGYYLEKMLVYLQRRIPMKYYYVYIRQFVDLLSLQKLVIPTEVNSNIFLQACIKHKVFSDKRYGLFLILIAYKLYILSWFRQAASFLKMTKRNLVPWRIYYRVLLMQPIEEKAITFLSSDDKMRQLFDAVRSDVYFDDWNIQFIDFDQLARRKWYSFALYRRIASSQFVICNSWTPDWIKKSIDTTWVQLKFDDGDLRLFCDTAIDADLRRERFKSAQMWDRIVVPFETLKRRCLYDFLFPERSIKVLTDESLVKLQDDDAINSVSNGGIASFIAELHKSNKGRI